MGTQGLLSVVQQNKVVVKVIYGTNGFNVCKLGNWLKQARIIDPRSIYDKAVELSIGSEVDLVVQYGEQQHIPESMELTSLYAEKFTEARFNPRWHFGTAAHVCVVDL